VTTALGVVSSLSPLLPGAGPPTFGLVYLINWLAYPNLPQGLADTNKKENIKKLKTSKSFDTAESIPFFLVIYLCLM